jgi:hypothetical protein
MRTRADVETRSSGRRTEHTELAWLSRPADVAQAVQTATILAAERLGHAESLGNIRAGGSQTLSPWKGIR